MIRARLNIAIVLTTIASVMSMVFGVVQAAAPPNIITYQGRVLNSNSAPVSDASLTMKFLFYTASTGGTCLWSNSSSDCDSNTPASTTGRSVTLTSGLFTENLGDTGSSYASIPDTVFADNSAVYLEVIIAGETLTPRKQITAAPYALNAQRLDGIDSTGFLASDGDTGTGDYDLTGAELLGASPIVFEGGSNDGNTTTFAFTDPTGTNTITFKDGSGTVAFTSDISGTGLWEDGTNGVYEDDKAVIVGADALFTHADGAVGDLRVADDLEVVGDAFVDGTITVNDLSCTDCLDFTELSDTLSLDASTSIAMSGDEALTITNSGTGNIVANLASTGDFVIQDGGSPFFTFNDDQTVDFASSVSVSDALDFTFDSIASANGIDVSVDGLTTGKGVQVVSSSGSMTSGSLAVVGHSGTYTTTSTLSGATSAITRDLTMNAGGETLSVTGSVLYLSNTGTQTAGTLSDTSNVLSVQQSYTGAAAPVIRVVNEGAGAGLFIDQNGNASALNIDSESTSAHTLNLVGDVTTTGSILRIVGSDFTDDSGKALEIDVKETTETSDIFTIQTDYSSTNNNVFRIEADGEAFSDVGFTAGAFSTNYYDGSITSTGTMTIDSSGTVQLGVDDDFLPQLGAGDANLGATGTRWDTVFATNADFTGTLTVSDLSCTDCLNFTDFADAMSLDASTSIVQNSDEVLEFSNEGTGDTIIDLQSTGQFVVQNGGTNMVMFDRPATADAGVTTSIQEIEFTTPTDTSGTNTHSGLTVDLNIGNAVGGGNIARAIAIDALTGDAEVGVRGLYVGQLTGTSATETAIQVDSGWDAALWASGATPNIWIDDAAQLTIEDVTGNNILVLSDISSSANHTISIDSNTALAFDSNADSDVDITTATNQDLRIKSSGTGDIHFGIDADSNFNILGTAAPGVDMAVISNSGFPSTTGDVAGLNVTFGSSNARGAAIEVVPSFAGGATDALEYKALHIDSFSPTNAAGTDTVTGLLIDALVDPGSTISSSAITLNAGWDRKLFFNDGTNIIDVVNGGSITFRDQTNVLMTLTDDGTVGSLSIAHVNSPLNVPFTLTGGSSTGPDPGENVSITGGTNNTSSASGGDGGLVVITGGAATGDGSVNRDGGNVTIDGGDSSIGNGSGGDVDITGGTYGGGGPGTDGNVTLLSGGSPTAVSVDGGDIGLSAKDDLQISADDDFNLSITSASAVVSLFDNALYKTIFLGGNVNDGSDTISIATHATTPDQIAIGNNNSLTTITLTGGNDWSVTSGGVASFSIPNIGSYTNALCWDNSGVSQIQDCVGSVSADYAERYPSAANVEYGHIVVPGDEIVYTEDEWVGRRAIRQAVLSSEPYQGPVIGIASNNYGDFTSAGGNVLEEDNPIPIALVGRVPVKVTNENGSIEVGDYLTTSSTPGHAMRASKVGRVIGMALSDFDGVTGEVMIQVNNGWYLGDIIGTDGTSTVVTDNVVVSSIGSATADEETFDSYGLSLRGSAWNGSEAEAVEMMIANVVTDEETYRLSVTNSAETEVAYITNEGTMRIAGDMVIGGNLYPSDRGTPQTEKYIYYDGSSGPGGDFMRTNAKGWSTGSYDFAEMFPSSEQLVPGDVVVFSGNGEYVRRSTGVSEETLAGIVSTRPGFLAGENVEGAHPIALAGRVPTRVTLEGGEISVGDPLTSSSTTGAAMKAETAGMIVGYALEPYTGAGDDKILVYVNKGYWGGEAVDTAPGTTSGASGFASNATQNYIGLNMSGNIFMNSYSLLNVGGITGMGNSWEIQSNGTIRTEGLIKMLTDNYQGQPVETIAVTSPEAVITLSGTSELVQGTAEVRFEQVVPEYNDVISAIAPIYVVVTPNGPTNLYVAEKDQNHFLVKGFGGGDVEFDWTVTAYRKGFEPDEPEAVVEEEEPVVTESSGIEEEVIEEVVEEPEEELLEEEVVVEEVADEVIEEDVAPVELAVEEEPAPEASPESPELTQVDSTNQDEGGNSAE